MAIVKLNESHKDAVKNLFVDKNNTEAINNLLYNTFVSAYLSNLTTNFHVFGYQDEFTGEIKGLISFYESTEEPAWYHTTSRSSGNNNLLRQLLDFAIAYNEANGRLKFYSVSAQKHNKLLRRFHWGKYNDDRYGYFDEYLVPAKTKCCYTNAWELLYRQTMLLENSIVRCNYLKQEHRRTLRIGGNI